MIESEPDEWGLSSPTSCKASIGFYFAKHTPLTGLDAFTAVLHLACDALAT